MKRVPAGMFALLAFLCLLLALLSVDAPFDLVVLGLMFMSLAMVFGSWPLGSMPWRRA